MSSCIVDPRIEWEKQRSLKSSDSVRFADDRWKAGSDQRALWASRIVGCRRDDLLNEDHSNLLDDLDRLTPKLGRELDLTAAPGRVMVDSADPHPNTQHLLEAERLGA